jgi:hypothetical protein
MLRLLNTSMAILTVDLELTNMEFVGKWHWLLRTVSYVANIVAHAKVQHERTDPKRANTTEYAKLENAINAL